VFFFSGKEFSSRIYNYWMEDNSTRMISSDSGNQSQRGYFEIKHFFFYNKSFISTICRSCNEAPEGTPSNKQNNKIMNIGGSNNND